MANGNPLSPGTGDIMATQPAPPDAPQKAADAPPAIPTGFPEPVAPDPPRKLSASGKVTLATVPPLGSVTVDDVTITSEGTEVDEATAQRARDAAEAGGYRLAEL
jgi:hypothetical protein